MWQEDGLRRWLESSYGKVSTGTSDGKTFVQASAHGLAARVLLTNFDDEVEARRCELEAIWQLKQLVDE